MSFASPPAPAELSSKRRILVLTVAFLAWMFAGIPMAITSLASRTMAVDLLRRAPERESGLSLASFTAISTPSNGEFRTVPESEAGQWFARYNTAFLLGAASGGLLFGWLGDRVGRAKALGLSILCYTGFSAASYFAQTVEQLLVLRFITCLGIGGTWPNAIALASEAFANVSRLAMAGLIGTAVNVGIVIMGVTATQAHITTDSWRWIMLLAAAPAPLGIFVLAAVPESRKWLAARSKPVAKPATPVREVFRPPLLWVTLIGICLGTVPLLGGWGSANWLMPWADQVAGPSDAVSKAWTMVSRSSGGAISSLLGGWLAGLMGRKTSYFFISLGSLLVSAYIFGGLGIFEGLTPPRSGEPTSWNYLLGLAGQATAVAFADVNWFSFWAFMLGVTAGFYFGWLPLCLPELFPTRVRSTGSGVTFNFGRVAAAAGVLVGGALMQLFEGDYARVGAITSLIYILGMVVIWLAPDTSKKNLED
jgi:SHS family sialic acid transporter-like MFS transporter